MTITKTITETFMHYVKVLQFYSLQIDMFLYHQDAIPLDSKEAPPELQSFYPDFLTPPACEDDEQHEKEAQDLTGVDAWREEPEPNY